MVDPRPKVRSRMRKLSVATSISLVRPVALEAPLEAVAAVAAVAASGSVGCGLQGQLGLQEGLVAAAVAAGKMQLRPARAVKYYPY
ncbi:hypothetical protein ACWNG8_08640 [Aeromonas veronii]